MIKRDVLISGPTGYVGQHLYKYFINNGYRVLTLYRNKQELVALLKAISREFNPSEHFNISKPIQKKEITKFLENNLVQFVYIDCIGSGSRLTNFHVLDEKVILNSIENNYFIPTLILQSLLPYLKYNQKNTKIINIGSLSEKDLPKGLSVYSSLKRAKSFLLMSIAKNYSVNVCNFLVPTLPGGVSLKRGISDDQNMKNFDIEILIQNIKQEIDRELVDISYREVIL
ncbi:MAG: SDR family NAD(P)-dependent oxidoreductase [Bdellovibrionales bacterium]|nr:SDR family NAD(P)-dependent oxidoreductase [Bdellovibrionales bacterium]